MARKFAGRFNRMYNCELFPLPQPFTFDGGDMIKVPGSMAVEKWANRKVTEFFWLKIRKTSAKK